MQFFLFAVLMKYENRNSNFSFRFQMAHYGVRYFKPEIFWFSGAHVLLLYFQMAHYGVRYFKPEIFWFSGAHVLLLCSLG